MSKYTPSTYEITREDIILASMQINQVADDRFPPKVFFEYNDKSWRLFELTFLGNGHIEIEAVLKSFDLGDGYYTMNTPKKKHKLHIKLLQNDPLVRELIDKICEDWERKYGFSYIKTSSIRKEYIASIHHRNRIHIVLHKIDKDIETWKSYTAHDEWSVNHYKECIEYLEDVKKIVETGVIE